MTIEIIKVFESKVINWLKNKKYGLIISSAVFVFLFGLSKAPYVNLFLNTETSLIITIFVSVFILNIEVVYLILLAILLLFPSMCLFILGKPAQAQKVGNIIYALIVLGVLRGMVCSFSAEEKKSM